MRAFAQPMIARFLSVFFKFRTRHIAKALFYLCSIVVVSDFANSDWEPFSFLYKAIGSVAVSVPIILTGIVTLWAFRIGQAAKQQNMSFRDFVMSEKYIELAKTHIPSNS